SARPPRSRAPWAPYARHPAAAARGVVQDGVLADGGLLPLGDGEDELPQARRVQVVAHAGYGRLLLVAVLSGPGPGGAGGPSRAGAAALVHLLLRIDPAADALHGPRTR